MKLIEPICYEYPHKEELVCTSPEMKSIWRLSLNMLDKEDFLAPLLIDDIKREGYIRYQNIENILKETVNKSFNQLPWFGIPVLESSIGYQYGNLGCKLFDSLYHKDILCSLWLTEEDWEWIVIHPESFKDQQAGMLYDLVKNLSAVMSFENIGGRRQMKAEDVRAAIRDKFLSRFTHYWIDNTGQVSSVTNPKYKSGKIQHYDITDYPY